ncbi:uncharacterized protein YxeA [Salirhabdus euzebyi]|uniref:Uncharacterized protein YxeA n=1 Tax=Salirhabdus euzebyi TaxID=394506 RepID=A0A841Q4J0_9BACI|nr:hypothetical protein [Salirhabdus euzebyi]MBB6453331.1 uncharacterized protein YxeA [Salirhabdus euzebyi]
MMKKILIGLAIVVGLVIACVAAIVIFVDDSKASYVNNFITQIHEEQTDEKGKEITEASFTFINEHSELFPTASYTFTDDNMNDNLSGEDLERNLNRETDRLFNHIGTIYDYYEVEWKGFMGENIIVSYIFVKDWSGYHYQLFYLDETDFQIGDEIYFVALPLMHSYYGNKGGGQTDVFMALASFVDLAPELEEE